MIQTTLKNRKIMNEMEKEYYDRFEIKLQDDLLRLCTSYQQLDGVLIA